VRGGGIEPPWLLTASTSTLVDRPNGRVTAASERQQTPASVPERPILVSCDRNDGAQEPGAGDPLDPVSELLEKAVLGWRRRLSPPALRTALLGVLRALSSTSYARLAVA
jgi:hypothetical protein